MGATVKWAGSCHWGKTATRWCFGSTGKEKKNQNCHWTLLNVWISFDRLFCPQIQMSLLTFRLFMIMCHFWKTKVVHMAPLLPSHDNRRSVMSSPSLNWLKKSHKGRISQFFFGCPLVATAGFHTNCPEQTVFIILIYEYTLFFSYTHINTNHIHSVLFLNRFLLKRPACAMIYPLGEPESKTEVILKNQLL